MSKKEAQDSVDPAEYFISVRRDLLAYGKDYEKRIEGSFFKKPSEDTKNNILTEALTTLAQVYKTTSEEIEKVASPDGEDHLSNLVKRFTSTIESTGAFKTSDGMKKLYSGVIHLLDALAPKSEEGKSESIASATDLLDSFERNKDGIAKETSVTAAPEAGKPLSSRRGRVARMGQAAPAESGLDDVDGTAVEVVMEAVAADGALADVLRELKVGNVQAGEAKSAIAGKTHAAEAEKEKGKAAESDGRAG